MSGLSDPQTASSEPATRPVTGGWDSHVHVFDDAVPVRAGHYLPTHRPLAQIEHFAATHGIDHLVLVQPSVYGSDNSVMLHALAQGQGRHRGVAVVEPDITDQELDRLHAAGVRGVRFNLVSPAGHSGDPGIDLMVLAPRLRERGWHVQWYAPVDMLAQLVRWQSGCGMTFVLDHLAGLHAGLRDDTPAWAAAQALANAGAWIKLSGWYRLATTAPWDELIPVVQRAAAMFGPRTVWGSDWPHTSYAPDLIPAYESTLYPVRAALGEAAFSTILCDHARALYDHCHT
jgi:predicted TIM-barrel fold metal-dependent hydrolase